jgi:hypothetical protein
MFGWMSQRYRSQQRGTQVSKWPQFDDLACSGSVQDWTETTDAEHYADLRQLSAKLAN